jgi:hypothetical protein
VRKLTWLLLLRWPLWAGVLQLVGTALIVWGLKVTTQQIGHRSTPTAEKGPHATRMGGSDANIRRRWRGASVSCS